MKSKTQDFISWASVNNWIPLIATAVGIALTYGTTLTRLALLEQKIDTLQTQQVEIISLLKEYQSQNQQLSLKINTLETIFKVK